MRIYLDTNISDFLKSNSQGQNDPSFETESFYNSIDVLCEGPIEGFVNYDGQTVNYVNINNATTIGQGVYYNDTPVIDPKSNLYNFSQNSFLASFGEQTKNVSLYSQAIYEYKTRIYDIPSAIVQQNKLNDPTIYSGGKIGFDISTFSSLSNIAGSINEINKKKKNFSTVVSHPISNKYSEEFDFNISLDNLYNIDNNNVVGGAVSFVIQAQNLSTGVDYYLYFNGVFVAKGGAIILPFKIEVESIDKTVDPFPSIIINVYSVRGSVLSSTNQFRSISLDSVVEYIKYPFSFPYSAVTYNTISSRHFNSIPTRSYDCKLLKIRVPDNYDAEAREYIDNWSGNFNKSLKWTNNPAWIFYDLCSNGRYGMARGQINETDLDKWQFLTLSKYCDELIKTNSRTKFSSVSFTFDNTLQYGQADYNTISFTTSLSISEIQERYPIGSIIYLYDIKNNLGEEIAYNYKKVICSVSFFGNIVKIKLCNDFGPRKVLEQDLQGDLFLALNDYLQINPNANVENKIKLYILKYFIGDPSLGLSYFSNDTEISRLYMSRKIFPASLNVESGYCVAKHDDFSEFLEPRFSCNVIINNQNEGLKTLTDLSSIFRGIFYFKNGLLSLTSDVLQSPVYIFSNSNVKDGLFTYASSDLNTSFSVVKVPYLDKYDKFKDKIVYVEDQELIRKFGIIEKEVLSFGTTSRSEAQRIGKWYLATGKLESEVVGFSTGIEATLLQIGNVIRISDTLKNASVIYGKIINLDFKDNYIYIDREVPENYLGKNIKIFSVINNKPSELNFSIYEIDNANLRLKIISERYFSWQIVAGIISSNNNKILSADSSLSAAWNKKAFSNQYFIDNCQISFKVGDVSSQTSIGLSEVNDINTSYTDITYRFRFNGSDFVIESNGSSVYSATGVVSISDIFKITYDSQYIRYYRNNELLASTQRTVGDKLYGVVALNGAYASITDLYLTHFPDNIYGQYSKLRSGSTFSIYINDTDSEYDLFKIISINEVSSNEYAVSAMRYQQEKFDIIEKNQYIDKNQNKEKQIVFSSEKNINELFSSSEISSCLSISTINYVGAVSRDFDFSFLIEGETLNGDYLNNKYEYMTIDFESLFDILLISRGIAFLSGLMCIINRNGKSLTFNVYNNKQQTITVFLGETQLGNASYKTTVDFYAFDSNDKIINV
jgi:hypothetical protein